MVTTIVRDPQIAMQLRPLQWVNKLGGIEVVCVNGNVIGIKTQIELVNSYLLEKALILSDQQTAMQPRPTQIYSAIVK